jgi:hypothetical protein
MQVDGHVREGRGRSGVTCCVGGETGLQTSKREREK